MRNANTHPNVSDLLATSQALYNALVRMRNADDADCDYEIKQDATAPCRADDGECMWCEADRVLAETGRMFGFVRPTDVPPLPYNEQPNAALGF